MNAVFVACLAQKKGKMGKKWEKARVMHRFLWYIIYGYQGSAPSSLTESSKESTSEQSAIPSDLKVSQEASVVVALFFFFNR